LNRKLTRVLLSVEWEGGFIRREKLAFKNQLRYGRVTVLYMFCGVTAAGSASWPPKAGLHPAHGRE